MTDIAIRVENLSKQYRIGAQKLGARTFREAVTDTLATPFRRLFHPPAGGGKEGGGGVGRQATIEETIWVLKDVSLRGEARRR